MLPDTVVRYFHFLSVFIMFAVLTVQYLSLKDRVEFTALKRAAVLNTVYVISAVVAALCGLGLWRWVGKPPGFYVGNWVFHSKTSLFVLTAILSIGPSVYIFKNRRSQQARVLIPNHIRLLIQAQLIALSLIPLLAVLMANGIGYIR